MMGSPSRDDKASDQGRALYPGTWTPRITQIPELVKKNLSNVSDPAESPSRELASRRWIGAIDPMDGLTANVLFIVQLARLKGRP
jgi:hypothetical protein